MEDSNPLFGLHVDAEANQQLYDTGRWARFLAIIGICLMGLFLLGLIVLGSQASRIFSELYRFNEAGIAGFLVIIVVIITTIAGSLLYFLLRGANNIRKGLRYNDQATFNNGLAGFRNFFIMYGIISVLGLFFSILALFLN